MAREDEVVELLKEIRDNQKAMFDWQREHSQKALGLYQQQTTQQQSLAGHAETEITTLQKKVFWTIVVGVLAYFVLTSCGNWIMKMSQRFAN